MSDDKWSNKFTKCIRCNTTLHPHKAKGLCNSCYQKEHEYPKIECSICGKVRRIHKIENGNVICSKCYKQPLHTCSICNKQASAAVKLSMTEYVCDSCYIKYYRNKQVCSICGELELLAINSPDRKVCIKCYSSPNHLCSKCGRNIESPYIVDEKHVCSRCYENSKTSSSEIDINQGVYICSICGNSESVQRIFSDNSIICQDCAKKQKKICNSCFNPLLPIHSHLNAHPYCRNCYYKQKFLSIYNEMNNDWHQKFKATMDDYFNNKALNLSWESIWERINESGSLFNNLYFEYVKSDNSFTSITLRKLILNHPSQKLFINDLMAFFYKRNIFKDYDSGIMILNNLDDQIKKLPTNFQNAAAAYKEALIIKLKKYNERGWIKKDSRFSYYTCYLYMLTAIRFFNFCSRSAMSQTTEITNQTLDAYLRLKSYDKGNLRHLVKYINKHKLTFTQLFLPCSNYSHEMNISLSEERQKQLLRDCLYNSNIRCRDRIIIVLMLLYGFTPQAISLLKISNFKRTKSGGKINCTLHINQVSHAIPEILIPLVKGYLNTLGSVNEYVFPGRYYDCSISLSSICRIVKAFDVTSTELYYTALNNAMINGLSQPALLMKSFGISPLTATRYFKLINNIY